MTSNSSKLISVRKPRRDFPLFPHATGRWAKKVRGKLRYFGKTADDPKGEAAEQLWSEQKDDLYAGRTPRGDRDGLTVGDLCGKFLVTKRAQAEVKKLTARSLVEYTRTADLLVNAFGRDHLVEDLRPEDFERLYFRLARKHGISTLGREITHCRSVFKYGVDSDLIARTVKFGPMFKSPSKADRRKARAKQKHKHGARMFEADEIQRMLAAAGPQLKAMILLGINGGLGNTDCATLPLSAFDVASGWLDFPRIKTGIERKIPLWPETVAALQIVIANRHKPRDDAHDGLVFLTRIGQPWVRYELTETKNEKGKTKLTGQADDAIAKSTAKLLKTLGIYRKGVTFYALRHTFETIAGGCRDQVAVDAVMGHGDDSMAAVYREGIGDDRLRAVVNHVRAWLFPEEAKKPTSSKLNQSSSKPANAGRMTAKPTTRAARHEVAEGPLLRIVG